jgi:glucose-1-phosphate adenylyltransferase
MKVISFPFRGYWEDIGTISAFYEANIRMTQPNPPFWFYDPDAPIYTRQRYLPPSRIQECQVRDSMIAEGCSVDRAEVQSSILGIRSRVRTGTRIVRSVVMGRESFQKGGIGRNCHVERAILDLNVQIGDRVEIRGAESRPDEDREDYFVRDGIVIIPKNAVIPSGTKI